MNDFQKVWDERYNDKEYIYGLEPNYFFKNFIDSENSGKILLPADGEGRNSVYAALIGWDCFAYDFSTTAKSKALKLAERNNVKINYDLITHKDFEPRENYFDVAALIFVHLSPDIRGVLHKKIINSVKIGGKIVLQAFSKKQIDYFSGGPKDVNLLYSLDELKNDFFGTEILHLEEKMIDINEGIYHKGNGWVIELIAKKV
jgi:hypothetical protein